MPQKDRFGGTITEEAPTKDRFGGSIVEQATHKQGDTAKLENQHQSFGERLAGDLIGGVANTVEHPLMSMRSMLAGLPFAPIGGTMLPPQFTGGRIPVDPNMTAAMDRLNSSTTGENAADLAAAGISAIPQVMGSRMEVGAPRIPSLGSVLKSSPNWEGVHPGAVVSGLYNTVRQGSRLKFSPWFKGEAPPLNRTPVWETAGTTGTPHSAPDFTPIPQQVLPSGREVGPVPDIPLSSIQPPGWQQRGTQGSPHIVPDFSPLPQQTLPSGRIPGVSNPTGPINKPTAPIEPVGTPAPTKVEPVQPQEMPLAEAHRYAHAQAQAAELPGSPAGARVGAHDALTEIAKQKYGKKSWHELSAGQMKEVGDWLLEKNNRAARGLPPL